MTPQTLFYILIAIIIISFVVDKILEHINAQRFDDPIPDELSDVYDKKDYEKSQLYKKVNYRFSLITSTFSVLLTLAFFFFDGFAIVNDWAMGFTDNSIVVALLFFGAILLASDLIMTPFSYYDTFVIEEKFGFNKSTRKLFFIDKIKGWLLGGLIGGVLLAVIIWFYEEVGQDFWLYAWGIITVFTVFINLFYAKLIVPLFNKQTPLQEGSLRNKIEAYASKVGFNLQNIYVIDGSKRSTKANAYFSGFGREKRITLYDTLINDLDEEEIVAVLAHEVGHYKKKHIIANLVSSIIVTGFTLWLLSVFIGNPLFSQALGVEEPAFHIGLIVFFILYSPLSGLTGLFMNYLSRTFEYQADNFAKETFSAPPLISSLKKLSKNNLSNLTPHPFYVFAHYSHPTLLQRYKNLKA